MTGQLLTPKQISMIEGLAAKAGSDTLQHRTQILLLYDEGKDTRQIAKAVGLSPRTVRYWRREFLDRGMSIFSTSTPSPKTSPSKSASITVALPRVRKTPGVKVDDPVAEAGRKVLRFHFAHMLSHEKGTRLGEDIEELHDMRVATRRMRIAFEVFGAFYKPKVVKFHLKGLRATGRALGRVRDLDVFMEKARDYLEAVPADERPGLDPLLNAWQQKRSDERDRMMAYLDSEKYQQFKVTFNEFVSTPGEGVRANTENDSRPDLVRHVAPVLIYTHLAAARSYDAIVDTAAIEHLHALRIEFKKLRYTLEFFREVLGEQSREVINDIKTLQDHLGNLNDADVACRILREFIATWEERQIDLPLHERKNPEPVVAYLAAKHAERHRLMITFPEAWAYFNRPEFLRAVALTVSVL
jgi:CHAD domain-containing protein